MSDSSSDNTASARANSSSTQHHSILQNDAVDNGTIGSSVVTSTTNSTLHSSLDILTHQCIDDMQQTLQQLKSLNDVLSMGRSDTTDASHDSIKPNVSGPDTAHFMELWNNQSAFVMPEGPKIQRALFQTVKNPFSVLGQEPMGLVDPVIPSCIRNPSNETPSTSHSSLAGSNDNHVSNTKTVTADDNNDDNISSIEKLVTDDEIHLCLHCSKTFLGFKDYRKHMFTFHRSKGYKTIVRPHPEATDSPPKVYECLECGKVYKLYSKLKDCMKQHSDEPLYECSVCQRRFHKRTDIIKHKRQHTARQEQYKVCNLGAKFWKDSRNVSNSGDKIYTCSVCEGTYHSIYELKRHFDVTHKNDDVNKRYCESCGTVILTRDVINKAKDAQSQTGIRYLQCDICTDLTTMTSSSAVEVVELMGMEVNPVKCQVCGFVASSQGLLDLHMENHQIEQAKKHAQQTEQITLSMEKVTM